ncbi:DUF58 domain-containing protein [Nocardioides insulae]|uniref:DUF58 domain-containing protein n=1 Tax=Nocardioides insulae TaxID=394734 RepID=UPI00041A4847|nr:DUF58 domain-containing protein [Nocardioides insulae]
MREALAGLTVRGRAFLAAGVTSLVCAALLGQPTLTRVGLLLIALPLLTAYVVGRARYRIGLVRSVTPQVASAGQPAQVQLRISNQGSMPSGALRLEERIPFTLGSRPRFVLERIEHGWHREVGYAVRPEVRGHYEIGPMTVRVSDPFGLVELHRGFHSTTPLVVTPRTVPLPSISLGGALAGSGDNRPRAFASGSAEDVTVREYRRGDDLRRVHWLSSARVGELMVRREEQDWQARATVLIDNRAHAHVGRGAASSLEPAVSMAASVAVHLTQLGYTVRLVTAGGDDSPSSWHVREPVAATGPLLEALAMVQPVSAATFDTRWLGEQGVGGLTVAVLGRIGEHDSQPLRQLHHHADHALAVAVDVDAWATTAAPGQTTGAGTVAALTAQGWRASRLGPDSSLDQAWRDLSARTPHSFTRTAPAPGVVQ